MSKISSKLIVIIPPALFGIALAVIVSPQPAIADRGHANTTEAPSAYEGHSPSTTCVGGADWDLEVIPQLDVARSTPRAPGIAFQVNVVNKITAAVTVNYAWVLSDDLGRVIAEGKVGSPQLMAAKGVAAGTPIRLPSILSDGFYRVATTIVGTDGKTKDIAQTHDWWLQIINGQIVELSSDEWNQMSRSNLPTMQFGVVP